MLIWMVWLLGDHWTGNKLEEVFDSREKALKYIEDQGQYAKYYYSISSRTVN